MANPQQPEVRRSERNPALSPDAMEAKIEARRQNPLTVEPGDDQFENRLGDVADGPVQDKPNLDEFAEKFGIDAD